MGWNDHMGDDNELGMPFVRGFWTGTATRTRGGGGGEC